MDYRVNSAPLFAALDAEAADSLKASMKEYRARRGDVIFVEGEPGDTLFVIAEGKVTLGHSAKDGRESLLAVLGPGEMFGELSVFDPGNRTATATALTDVSVMGLSREVLRNWLIARPEVSLKLFQALAQRLRRTEGAMADLIFSDVPGRIAKAILELSDKFGVMNDEGLFVPHDLTQEELAQLVGASRETVNKALAEFASRGWLKVEQRSVTILDIERIRRRAA